MSDIFTSEFGYRGATPAGAEIERLLKQARENSVVEELRHDAAEKFRLIVMPTVEILEELRSYVPPVDEKVIFPGAAVRSINRMLDELEKRMGVQS